MQLRPKNSLRRKDSSSRQRPQNIRSHSRSAQKSKQRSNTKLMSKFKTFQPSHQQPQNPTYPSFPRVQLKKTGSGRQLDTSDEYYSFFRGKSKSKGKLNVPLVDQNSKVKYLNSVYMHKDSVMTSEGHGEVEKESVVASSTLLNKIKMLQRNCGIDANGKIVNKETVKAQYKNQGHTRNMDSQNTISIYDGEKRKEKKRIRDKNKKQMIRTVKSKRGDNGSDLAKITAVKSSQKCMKKKQTKQFFSPVYVDRDRVVFRKKDSAKEIISSRNKTQLLQETRSSPYQQAEEIVSFELPMGLNIEDIISQLKKDSTLTLSYQKLKMIYRSDMIVQRAKCIELLSRICSIFSARRQAHSLAVFYLDKYMSIIQKEVTPKQLKLISMTALLLALKMDDGIMSRKVCHQYINHMDNVLQMNASRTHNDNKSKSISKNKEGGSRDNSFTLAKSKSQTSFGDFIGQSRKSRKQQVVHSKQMKIILSMELDMMLKFSFKLVHRSSTYWIDTLTLLWDNYVNQELNSQIILLFRSDKNKKNISHLYQIIEKISLSVQMYKYSTPSLVLGAMYLIVRMQLEEQKDKQNELKIYAKFVQNLAKSPNLIFYDNVGVNELFGDFLDDLEMNISTLIESIRFVGKNLDFVMKTFAFHSKNKNINPKDYQHQLSLYEDSGELYKGL